MIEKLTTALKECIEREEKEQDPALKALEAKKVIMLDENLTFVKELVRKQLFFNQRDNV